MVRSMVAVAAGYGIFVAAAALIFGLSGQEPGVTPGAGFLLLSVGIGMAAAFVGGYVAGVLAGKRETFHAAIVAVLMGAIALLSMVAAAGSGSVWSQVSVLILMVPATLVGGAVRERRRGQSA